MIQVLSFDQFKSLPAPVPAAMMFAVGAHEAACTVRKYTGESYTVHLAEVASLVWQDTQDPVLTAAAWLHDTVEDTAVSLELIRQLFGAEVASLVEGLTDPKMPGVNRAARMEHHKDRLSSCSYGVQTIKCADICSNTQSIVLRDPKFAVVYLREKRDLLAVMVNCSQSLKKLALEAVNSDHE